jgi:SPP1 gp7 family putative phage head morphogenesis protein
MKTQSPTSIQQALWATAVQRKCLIEANGDVEAGLAAAEYILATQPIPNELTIPISAFFADIANQQAQNILSRALRAAKGLSEDARKELRIALGKGEATSGHSILDFIEKYRLQLANLLTTTQLAAVLEGAREVADKVPQLKEDASNIGPIPQPTFIPPKDSSNNVHLPVILEAAKQLAEKNVLTPHGYDALNAMARAKSFTIAGVDATETLTKIRDSLSKNVKDGADYETFKSSVLDSLDEGTFLSEGHLETLFRTNVQTAFSDGQMTVLQHPLIRDGFPYAAYDSIHDDRVRSKHKKLDTSGINGTNIYRSDDPVFQMFRPPWDYNCRCSWTPITVRQAAEAGVEEAQRWLDSGVEPSSPTFVPTPAFTPPEGFNRSLADVPLSIQLSMQPLASYLQGTNELSASIPNLSPKGPPLATDDYPKDKANKFLDKSAIIESANNPAKYQEIRESIPEEQRRKLDKCVSHLMSGGTIHHPKESPGLAVDISGAISDPSWADYTQAKTIYSMWSDRKGCRNECREQVDKAIKILRKDKPDLDEVEQLLERAGATGAEMRSLSRIRHRAKSDDEELDLEDTYEDIAESIHQRLDKDEESDPEPFEPEEPPVPSTTNSAFAMRNTPGKQWITIGGHEEGEEKHVGGFRVLVEDDGTITKGRMRGTKVKDVKSHFDRIKGKGGTSARGRKQPQQGSIGQGGAGTTRGAPANSEPVAPATPGPNNSPDGRARQDSDKSPGPGPSGDAKPAAGATGTDTTSSPAARHKETIDKVNKRLDRYTSHFRAKGNNQVADWLDLLKEHVNEVGVSSALASLGAEKTGGDMERVQYKGTGEFDPTSSETEFIKRYLDRAGIILQTTDTPDPNFRTIASHPVPADTRGAYKEGSIIPTETTLQDKLEESKHLPGLESTEDLDIIAGAKVSKLTPDVLAKLDARYGKGKWIIKTYGDEAYAGFGIYFPERVQAIQQSSKDTLWDQDKRLKRLGYRLHRDESGEAVGIIKKGTEQVYKFNSAEFEAIPDERVKKLGRVAAAAAPSEKGARLPGTSEQNLLQDYGIALRKDDTGKIIGIVSAEGTFLDFGTPQFKEAMEEYDDGGQTEHEIERAVTNAGYQGNVRYMAQPAFEAVGVTEEERALGLTWETSKEGRVHIVVRNGKATVIPYATMAGRGDALPAVFADEDIRAMERAAQEAIDALPESERTGQVYAPDVMKTKDGWRVVEVNAAVETGQSLWLEQNPLVMDAYISHMTGRDPAHVRFIRGLLRDRMKGSRTPIKPQATPAQPASPSTEPTPTTIGAKPGPSFSADDFDSSKHPRRGKGKGGGQFVEKDKAGISRSVRSGKIRATYSTHSSTKIKGPKIPLKNYKQQDVHSCGFVAALTIARYFKPDTRAKEVLDAVRPMINSGVDQESLVSSLEKLGIRATFSERLTVGKLARYVEQGIPVIISVWPDEWTTDHWTIVQGFDETRSRVYLTNHKSLTIADLKKQWSDMDMRGQGGSREGLICRPIVPKKKKKKDGA